MARLEAAFFDRDALLVARDLLGKRLKHQVAGRWLAIQVVETEAYFLAEKGSHASLGWTPKRQALFMPPGTIYMYYARGGDSFNISCRGAGNAVLIKSAVIAGYPSPDPIMLEQMHALNPPKNRRGTRALSRLCAGQTLLCKSLGLKVPEWDARMFTPDFLDWEDTGYSPQTIIQTTRLGIPAGRDEHLPLRLIDAAYLECSTSNPLRSKKTCYEKKPPQAIQATFFTEEPALSL